MKDKKLLFGLFFVGVLNIGLSSLENPLDFAFFLAKKNWISLNEVASQGGTPGGVPSSDPVLRPYALEIRSLMARGYSAQESSAAVRQKMALDLGPHQDRQIRTRLKSLEEKQILRNMGNPSRRSSENSPSAVGQGGPDRRNPGERN
jgi:hypothetical protein